jgi:hypothetical protein
VSQDNSASTINERNSDSREFPKQIQWTWGKYIQNNNGNFKGKSNNATKNIPTYSVSDLKKTDGMMLK